MKILGLIAENIKKIKVVKIDPKGNMVEITGPNGSGKSSVLDSIWLAIKGMKDAPVQPIRQGEKDGYVTLELDELTVTRTFKVNEEGETTTKLTVTNKEGFESKSPQDVLNKLVGPISFDPLEFTRLKEKDQVEFLKNLVSGFDFKASEKLEANLYAERTVVNRKAQESTTLHIFFKDVPVIQPEKVDVTELTNRLTQASQTNADIEKIRAERKDVEKQIETEFFENGKILAAVTQDYLKASDIFEKAKKDFEEARKTRDIKLAECETAKVSLEERKKTYLGLYPLPSLENVSEISEQLKAAQAKNEIYETWKKKEAARVQTEEFQRESQILTEKIEQCKKDKTTAITKANLPIKGLGFNESGVLLSGIPFKQCSSAEQLRTS